MKLPVIFEGKQMHKQLLLSLIIPYTASSAVYIANTADSTNKLSYKAWFEAACIFENNPIHKHPMLSMFPTTDAAAANSDHATDSAIV